MLSIPKQHAADILVPPEFIDLHMRWVLEYMH